MGDEGDWILIGLDEKMARRQGMPARLPVPRGEFEGLADKGLAVDSVRAWIKEFLTNSEPGKSGAWRKKNAQVVSRLEAFLDKAPLWDRAQAAFGEGAWDKAVSALKRITVMDADDHAARLNLASAQANLGDHAAALKSFAAIKKTFEGDADYHVAVGHVHLAVGQRDQALDQMVLALEAKPDCQPALDALEKLGVLVRIYENPRDAASLTYVRADSVADYLRGQWDAEKREAGFFLEQLAYHEREGRHELCLHAAERALAAHPDAAGAERAEVARVSALRALGRGDDALAAARSYLERAPRSAGARVELARCLSASGKSSEARAEIDAALEADPGDQSALVLKFWPDDASDLQKVSGALPALRSFAEAHAEVPGAWRSLARAELVVGRVDDALATFAKAVALAPNDDDLRAEYWGELGKAARYQEILSDAARLENIGKRDWKLRWNEAEAYAGLGKKVEARGAFSAINFDETLHVDVRRRAKRAVTALDEAGT